LRKSRDGVSLKLRGGFNIVPSRGHLNSDDRVRHEVAFVTVMLGQP